MSHQYGNNITGNGSFEEPYLTLGKAIDIANSLATSTNPITITISTGIYIEDNSTGPFIVMSDGISIVGAASNAVTIIPNTPTNDLLLLTNTISISNITFESLSPLATALSFTAGCLSLIDNVRIFNFLIGIDCSGGTGNFYLIDNCFLAGNGTGLRVDNTLFECKNTDIFGTLELFAT